MPVGSTITYAATGTIDPSAIGALTNIASRLRPRQVWTRTPTSAITPLATPIRSRRSMTSASSPRSMNKGGSSINPSTGTGGAGHQHYLHTSPSAVTWSEHGHQRERQRPGAQRSDLLRLEWQRPNSMCPATINDTIASLARDTPVVVYTVTQPIGQIRRPAARYPTRPPSAPPTTPTPPTTAPPSRIT